MERRGGWGFAACIDAPMRHCGVDVKFGIWKGRGARRKKERQVLIILHSVFIIHIKKPLCLCLCVLYCRRGGGVWGMGWREMAKMQKPNALNAN